MSVSITFGGLSWKCPGCSHVNHDDDMYPFDNPTLCVACEKRWQACPNEDCYFDDDCPTCGGNSGGLIEVKQ
jgi:hypothetical protein